MSLRNSQLLAAGFVFTLAFALYNITLAPTVTLVDSGELILAARDNGVAHPPGFPLYLMVAHLFSLLPIGNVAMRIHLASALFGALAAMVMTLLVNEAMMFADRTADKNASSEEETSRSLASTIAPAVIAGLLFAFSRTLWSYATIAEVYTLNSLLIVTVFWLILAWLRAQQTSGGNRKLYLAALIFGLAMGVHHLTVLLTLPALAVLAALTKGRSFFFTRQFLFAALFAIGGLAVYAYLPLAASQSPLMNWGDPRTLESFWWHISGRQYRVFFEFSPSRIAEFAMFAMREFSAQWLPLALVSAIAGFIYTYRRTRPIFWFLVLVVAIDLLFCLGYDIAEDKDAYYLPAFIALIVAAGFGGRWLIDSAGKLRAFRFLTPAGSGVLLLVIPLTALVSNYGYNDRSDYFVAQDYVENTVKAIEPRSMLLTTDWQFYSPSLYTREIEGQRKDAVVIDVNLLRRSWYFGYLEQAYPETMQRSRDKADAYLGELRAWEREPDLYEKSATLNQRINARFNEMMVSLVADHLQQAPVYLTSEFTEVGSLPWLAQTMGDKHQLVPQGLVFRIVEKSVPFPYQEPKLVLRGIGDGTLRFEDDDVAMRVVKPVYLKMLTNTGMFLVSQGKRERATIQLRQALAIDPNFEPAKRALAAAQNISTK